MTQLHLAEGCGGWPSGEHLTVLGIGPRSLRQFVAKPWAAKCHSVAGSALRRAHLAGNRTFLPLAVRLHSKQIVPDVFVEPEPESVSSAGRDKLAPQAWIFLGLALTLGAGVMVQTAAVWSSPDLIKFAAFLSVALFSAGARVRVPGASAPVPLSYFFVLLSLVELTAPETILLACAAGVVQ